MKARSADAHSRQLEIARKELREEAQRWQRENQADDSILRHWREFDLAYAKVTNLHYDPNEPEAARLRTWTQAWLELARVVDRVLGLTVVDLKGEVERPGVRVTAHLFEIARRGPSMKRFEKELEVAWAELVAARSTFDMTVYFSALRDTVKKSLNGKLAGQIRRTGQKQQKAETTTPPVKETARETTSSQATSNPSPSAAPSGAPVAASTSKEDSRGFGEALTEFVRIALRQEERKRIPLDTGDPCFPAPEWIPIAAASKVLSLSPSNMHRWTAKHKCERVQATTGRNRILVRREELGRMLREVRSTWDLTPIQ